MNTTTLRAVWNGQPVELREAWTLRKRNHVAVCRVSSHEFGWELRLEVTSCSIHCGFLAADLSDPHLVFG